MKTFILLFQCKDQKGIIAKISDFIFKHGGNIVAADQHSTDAQNGYFFMRVEFSLEGSNINKDILNADLSGMAQELGAQYSLYDKSERLRMGILVSEPDHCLFDLLYLWKSGELKADISFVLSNCQKHREFVGQYKIPFYFIPATKEDRKESEILSYAKNTDLLVLARYMLVLSEEFLRAYGKDIINIHHGFLPSFKGALAYQQALDKGVKVIGSTAHFASEKLDEGPIISQAVEYVSHKDDLEDLIRKGKNLENRALGRAVSDYLNHRIIRFQHKTIVF